MPPWVSAVITPSPIEARVIWARSRSASRAFSTSWRCVSCCRVRRNARRMSTLAVVRLATSSSLSKARVDLGLPLLHLLGAGLPGADARAHLAGDVDQFHDVLVAHQPQLDGALEVTEVVEVAVQPDDRGNVVGMVAALEDALAGRLDVRVGLVQGKAHLAVAEGDRDGLLVAAEVFVGA